MYGHTLGKNFCAWRPIQTYGQHTMLISELLIDRYAPLHDLCDKTIHLYKMTLDRFGEFLGHTPVLTDLDDLIVCKFLRWRAVTPHRGRLCSHGSVLKDRSQLVAIFNWAAKKRLVPEFPSLPRMKSSQKLPRAYTVSDVSKLILKARRRRGLTGGKPSGWWWSGLIYCGWCTGERIGAMLQLRWRDVDLDARRIVFVASTRKGHTRDIARSITPDLAEQLRLHVGQPGDLVWHWDRHPISLFPSLACLAKAAGVTPRGFHGLRKSGASYLKAAGGDPTKFLDHSNPKITLEHYIDETIGGAGEDALTLLPKLDLG